MVRHAASTGSNRLAAAGFDGRRLYNHCMRVLVTAGNTQTPIDRVRCLTNIFTGRTGAQIATAAAERGHVVTFFTSHPETVTVSKLLQVQTYRTFDDLHALMAGAIPGKNFDSIVHAAAVGDYL